ESIGQKIRSPGELAIGLLRSLDATASTQRLSVELGELGQLLFYPPNVKGWDGGLAWINSATLLGRANLVKHLIEDRNAKFGGGTLPQYIERLGWTTPAEVVDGLSELWLATELTPDLRTALMTQLDMLGGNRQRGLQQLIHTLGSLPEFQLS
ncbi:MAG TPA: DUF1800 family protein, partial [Pirellulaceae bacterium]|nr:DUF1800 family protein [Pirellulaceae bacterium]